MQGSRLEKSVDQYLATLESEGLTHRYLTAVRSSLMAFTRYCEDRGVGCTNRVTLELVGGFLSGYASHSASHQMSLRTHVRKFLERTGSFVMKDYHAKIKGSARTRVRWLTEEQVAKIHETPMTPEEQLLIVFPLEMGLRPCEVLRLRFVDARMALQYGDLSVIGKTGERPLPMHPDLKPMLESYLLCRRGEDLDTLLPFKRTKAQRIYAQFSEKVGFQVRGYDLRRTCGRRMWQRQVKTASIARLYGHSSQDQTLEYIGANRTDIQEAYEKTRIINPLISIKPLAR
jgi:integrase